MAPSLPRLMLLHRGDIDTEWWDLHIRSASFSLPYALSWYLDSMAEDWMAVVSEDEQWVMPLPVNRKILGLRQVYMPPLVQQLGLFGQGMPDPALTDHFISYVARRFIRIAYRLHEGHQMFGTRPFQVLPNILLPLDKPYEVINSQYNRALRRRLLQQDGKFIIRQDGISIASFVTNHHQALIDKLKLKNFSQARRISFLQAAMDNGACSSYEVMDSMSGHLLAAGFFLIWKRRIINISGYSTHEGRHRAGMAVLLDHVVKCHAGSNKIFDFEGSSIPGIAQFFLQFGGETVPYYLVRTVFPGVSQIG